MLLRRQLYRSALLKIMSGPPLYSGTTIEKTKSVVSTKCINTTRAPGDSQRILGTKACPPVEKRIGSRLLEFLWRVWKKDSFRTTIASCVLIVRSRYFARSDREPSGPALR